MRGEWHGREFAYHQQLVRWPEVVMDQVPTPTKEDPNRLIEVTPTFIGEDDMPVLLEAAATLSMLAELTGREEHKEQSQAVYHFVSPLRYREKIHVRAKRLS